MVETREKTAWPTGRRIPEHRIDQAKYTPEYGGTSEVDLVDCVCGFRTTVRGWNDHREKRDKQRKR